MNERERELWIKFTIFDYILLTKDSFYHRSRVQQCYTIHSLFNNDANELIDFYSQCVCVCVISFSANNILSTLFAP